VGLKSAIMAELASIGAALSTVKTLWDLAKNVKDSNVGMKITAELGNIQGQLIEVQQKTISIQQKNQELRDELQRYKSFTFHHSVAWRRLPDSPEDGPFCPICIAESLEMHLLPVNGVDQTREYWFLYCPTAHEKAQGAIPAPGPYFHIPKNLVPEGHYAVRAKA
jgi:hypothetical protein